MPELPEVETVRTYLDGVMSGREIEEVILYRKDLRFRFPNNFRKTLEGAVVRRVSRRGKLILIVCCKKEGKERTQKKKHEKNVFLWLVHLGMSGRLLWFSCGGACEVVRHRHVCIRFVGGSFLCYEDARRFGFMEVAEGCEEDHNSLRLDRMGIEPLSKNFTKQWLWDGVVQGARGQGRTIKDTLMDQGCVAGLGNIYVNEALWAARVHPFRRVGSMSRVECGRIVSSIKKILSSAIAAGGSTLRDYRGGDGELGYFQLRLRAYGRGGEACRRRGCGGRIVRVVRGGRASYFCARVR